MEQGAPTRLKLTVQYDGTSFRGWQVQPDLRTVQGELESALSRLADKPRTVVGSGRTDTGVHATGQVAIVDMDPKWTAPRLFKALNAILPRDIWVPEIVAVPLDFHPRFHALRRTYEYRVGLRPEARSPFQRRWCWPVDEEVDTGLLTGCAPQLLGEHSFQAFAKAGQPHLGHRCHVFQARWDPWELGHRLTITSNRYLHHMVRYLVGTMMDVAIGRRPQDHLASLLQGAGGLVTSPPAPPEGLFLAKVEYPDHGAPVDDESNPLESPDGRRTASA